MSHITALANQIRDAIAGRNVGGKGRGRNSAHREFTKDQLWDELVKLKAQAGEVEAQANFLARDSHNYAQSMSGEDRRRMLEMRNRAHVIASIARGEQR